MAPDSALAALNLAVVGHVEWVSFVAVEQLPVAGSIDRATAFLEEPAGGGAVVAVQLARLSGKRVRFFTSRSWVLILRWPGGMPQPAGG
jgi:ribokinase